MLTRLVSCLRASPAAGDADAAASPHVRRFASTSTLYAAATSSSGVQSAPSSSSSSSPLPPPPPPPATQFSLTAAACGGDGICGPVLCLPAHQAFDPMHDADNPWHAPLPDVALDAQLLWLRGLYWSFAVYILGCIGLLVAHTVIFGLSASLAAASSLESDKRQCSSVYFVRCARHVYY